MKVKKMKELTKEQEEFEFLANRRGLNLTRRSGTYVNNITAEMWYWWQVVRTNEPRELLDEWNRLLEESKKWKGKLNIFQDACSDCIDSSFMDTSWESQFMVNEQSSLAISLRKDFVKKRALRTLADIDDLVGIEWLVCGLSEENHKRIRAKVRTCISSLGEKPGSGYLLESITQSKVSNAIIKQTKHGLQFTDKVMQIAREMVKDAK